MAEDHGLQGQEVRTMMVKVGCAQAIPRTRRKIIDGIEKVNYQSPRGDINTDPNDVANVPIYLLRFRIGWGAYP